MLALCFVSYVGVGLTIADTLPGFLAWLWGLVLALPRLCHRLLSVGFKLTPRLNRPKLWDVRNMERQHRMLGEALERLPNTRGRWTVVWGPALYRPPYAVGYINFLCVLRSTQEPDSYVVLVRGTNLASASDWVLEDLLVKRWVVWPYSEPALANPPRVSLSAAVGLRVLCWLRPPSPLPGANRNLFEFLKDVISNASSAPTIHVTGHSKGGLLSSTLALALRDSQGRPFFNRSPDEQWDPDERARVECTSFAGPTAGNEAFSSHSDTRLGTNMRRVHLDLDGLTSFWDEARLERVPKIYSPEIELNLIERLGFRVLKRMARGKGYTQIGVPVGVTNALNPNYTDVVTQLLHQHFYGYARALGIENSHGDLATILEGKLFTELQTEAE